MPKGLFSMMEQRVALPLVKALYSVPFVRQIQGTPHHYGDMSSWISTAITSVPSWVDFPMSTR